ncbi:MAG: Gfo/Idh/MocA family oxidoreductase [Acidobacteria bacterium]|nr:Gfo/Idh/MocA family oxidoreductase [Acidobacteriota bacterium]
MSDQSVNRRDFVKQATQVGAALGLASQAFGARPGGKTTGRVVGANDRIQIGVIGVGGRGSYLADEFAGIGKRNNGCQIMAVCDVWQKRVTQNKQRHNCDGTLDYREVLSRSDIDAVLIATPDHWHAKIALEAMDKGKDVYLEKPMCHTIEEAKQLASTVRETKRVLQVGSQTTSSDQWHKAKKAIADGMIGPMIMSQGSYHRNSIEGEWNWKIDPDAGPDGKGDNYIDWKMWLGPAQKRAWDADRYFRFRKYWDYSGGVATDLFYHVVAPMNICWGEPQFPHRVAALGGIWAFKDREVPDTFNLLADYKSHSLVLSSSMANSQHIPGLIRGKDASLIMVDHGRFEGHADHITVLPERAATPEYKAKFGTDPIKIPIENTERWAHMQNFLDCVRSRQKPTLDVETGMRAQVTITMAVQSYREGRVLYWDEKTMKVTPKPPKSA